MVNNRKKIIDTASHLFGEKGIEKTSLADIAKEVGISKGTLYYYYATKNDLIFDITEVHMEKITGGIFSLIEKNKGDVSWKGMMKLLVESLLKSETRTRLHLYLLQEVLSGNPELKKRFIRTYNQWFKMVEDGYKMITSSSKDISVQARILVSVIDGMIIQASIGVNDVSLDSILAEISKIIDD
ncbi:MAG: TetR/AcrR family transcriptional regulator [Proteobacteria bacterium]|nr:TetR/AcrR family transcriptional regulator [Pseudomonadota bacterium]